MLLAWIWLDVGIAMLQGMRVTEMLLSCNSGPTWEFLELNRVGEANTGSGSLAKFCWRFVN